MRVKTHAGTREEEDRRDGNEWCNEVAQSVLDNRRLWFAIIFRHKHNNLTSLHNHFHGQHETWAPLTTRVKHPECQQNYHPPPPPPLQTTPKKDADAVGIK
ncbi:hypothetical protein J6590_065020 [Homalodisca vitripennis]|nr:hypothetical protein J6590_065020 [Homalodisca vitripennis]